MRIGALVACWLGLSCCVDVHAQAPSHPASTPSLQIVDGVNSAAVSAIDAGGYQVLAWTALRPVDWDPWANVHAQPFSGWTDADPRATAALATLKSAWERAPVVAALDGRRARLSGFVVTLERDSHDRLKEFLLVPNFGACIHAPPPPPNQTILVDATAAPTSFHSMDAVTVWGTLRVLGTDTEMGRSGYTLTAADVEELPLAPTDGRSREGRRTLTIVAIVCALLPALVLAGFLHHLQRQSHAPSVKSPATRTHGAQRKRKGKRKK